MPPKKIAYRITPALKEADFCTMDIIFDLRRVFAKELGMGKALDCNLYNRIHQTVEHYMQHFVQNTAEFQAWQAQMRKRDRSKAARERKRKDLRKIKTLEREIARFREQNRRGHSRIMPLNRYLLDFG